jgi:hypothetical protein
VSAALEILLCHPITAGIRGADDPYQALHELREAAAGETRALCDLARRGSPKVATEALAVAEDLARIVGEIANDVGRVGEPIGPRRVLTQRRRVTATPRHLRGNLRAR